MSDLLDAAKESKRYLEDALEARNPAQAYTLLRAAIRTLQEAINDADN